MHHLREKGGLLAHLADQVLEGNFGNGPLALQILKLINAVRFGTIDLSDQPADVVNSALDDLKNTAMQDQRTRRYGSD